MTFILVRIIIFSALDNLCFNKTYILKELFKIAGKNKIFGPIVLVTAAMIWGLSFVAQNEGMNYIGGFTFNGIRMLIGSAVLFPIILINKKKNSTKLSKAENKLKTKSTLIGILLVGLCLFAGSNLQQFAFNYTEVGKVGFITALYMIIVPIFGLFLKKKPPFTVWIGIVLGLTGLYFICIGGSSSFSIGKGEILTLLCAIAYALHILIIDRFASEIDAVVLSCGQFFITGVLSCILMFIFEEPSIDGIKQALIPILYSGIMSSGVAFTLQIVGQKHTEPTIAAMLLCLESVFSVLFAFIVPPHEKLMPIEYLGCAIIFVGIIIAQITPKSNKLN